MGSGKTTDTGNGDGKGGAVGRGNLNAAKSPGIKGTNRLLVVIRHNQPRLPGISIPTEGGTSPDILLLAAFLKLRRDPTLWGAMAWGPPPAEQEKMASIVCCRLMDTDNQGSQGYRSRQRGAGIMVWRLRRWSRWFFQRIRTPLR